MINLRKVGQINDADIGLIVEVGHYDHEFGVGGEVKQTIFFVLLFINGLNEVKVAGIEDPDLALKGGSHESSVARKLDRILVVVFHVQL